MGERALAAVLHGDISWYRSQWGGSESILTDVFEQAACFEPLLGVGWESLSTRESREPAAKLDFLETEVVYVLDTFGVLVYLPLWFGLPTDHERTDRGVLVHVDSLDAIRETRTALRRCKELVLDWVRTEAVTPAMGRALLSQVEALVRATAPTIGSRANIYTGERGQGGV